MCVNGGTRELVRTPAWIILQPTPRLPCSPFYFPGLVGPGCAPLLLLRVGHGYMFSVRLKRNAGSPVWGAINTCIQALTEIFF